MIKVPMNIYMKTLSGYINDEDKLVTYKWLSNELEVHVNVAKRILKDYWNKHKNDNIVATILIMGYLNDNEMRIELVKESDLTVASKKYIKIISQHIYSIQKTLSDLELLADTGEGDIKYGAIHCEKCVLLTDEELFERRWGTAMEFQTPQEERNLSIDKTAYEKKSDGITFFKESVENKKPSADTAKSNEADKTEEKKIALAKTNTLPKKGHNYKVPVQSKKAGFNNLFSKVPATSQKKSPSSNVNKKDPLLMTKYELTQENLDNTNNSNTKSPNIYKMKLSDEEQPSSDNLPKMANESTSLEKNTDTITKLNLKSSRNKKSNRGMKRERSEEFKTALKRRKRILVDSDSSEESGASDDEVIFDSPPRALIEKPKSPSPPRVENINGKQKIRKLVDKTYMDEDGFLVTKREHVYESCSEEEEIKIKEPKKKTELLPKTIKKQQTTKKTQTTLMNFIKKG